MRVTSLELSWASGTEVADKDGTPIVVFHGTKTDFEEFDPEKCREGIHFGTLAQAQHRARKGGVIKAAVLRIYNPARLIDQGQWSQTLIADLQKEGHDGIVYLNRYEGTNPKRVDEVFAHSPNLDLDRIPDRTFQELFPENQDSYLVFHPSQIRLLWD